MNTKNLLLTLVSSAVMCAGSLSYAADQSAMPPAAQDSKTQLNNPAGPAAQTPSTNKTKDSKQDASSQNTTDMSNTNPASGPAATKTPQKTQDQTNK